ncbi:MAG: hypothetical protein IPJ79_04155 [Bacteroidetes bacterium]|nr:hypothetical protein [Bacteroidota bacterium]
MKKYLIITAAIVLAAVIYFAPKKSSKQPVVQKHEHNHGFNEEEFLATAKKSLQFDDIAKVESFDKDIAKSQMLSAYDSAASVFDKAKRPDVAAFYFERKATKEKTEGNYLNAAYRFFDGFKMAKDSTTLNHFVERAIYNYEKVLEISPNNLNAKTDLGICYAEGSANHERHYHAARSGYHKPKTRKRTVEFGIFVG